jgi:hypothetical protein
VAHSREAGLNLVLFHEAQAPEDVMVGLPDATGLHGAILQSATTVDYQRRTIVQAKAGIIIGKAWLVLRRHAKIGE